MNEIENEIELEFVEGKSSKFWRARVDDTNLVVHFGRIGTAGQTKAKSFATVEAARWAQVSQAADKRASGYKDRQDRAPDEIADAKTPLSSSVPIVRIRLDDATLRRAQVLPLPDPKPKIVRPWNPDELAARIRKMDYPDATRRIPSWKSVDLDSWPSIEEAAFWVHGFTLANSYEHISSIAEQVSAFVPDTEKEIENSTNFLYMCARLGIRCHWVYAGPVAATSIVAKEPDYARVVTLGHIHESLLCEFDSAERGAFRDALLSLSPIPDFWALALIATIAPDPEYVASTLSQYKDGSGRQRYFDTECHNEALGAILGLRDPDRILAEMERLEAFPASPDDLKRLLAATGFRAVTPIAKIACQQKRRLEAEAAACVLALAEGPLTAPAMLDILLESKAAHVAREWFQTFPEFAIEGLLPVASAAGKRGEAARDILIALRKRGYGDAIETALAGVPDAVASSIRKSVFGDGDAHLSELADDEIPDWLAQCLSGHITVPDAVADENPPRRIHVEPVSIPVPPTTLPDFVPLLDPEPFDFEAEIGRMRAFLATADWWRSMGQNLPLSPDAARFWLLVAWCLRRQQSNLGLSDGIEKLLRERFGGDRSRDDQETDFSYGAGYNQIAAIWAMSGIDGILKWVEDDGRGLTADFFGALVLPFLNGPTRVEVKDRLIEHMKRLRGSHRENAMLALAAVLGATATEFEEIFAAYEPLDDWRNVRWFSFLFRLPSGQSMVAAASRLNAYPNNEEEARQWLARTGFAGIDVLKQVADLTNPIKYVNDLVGPDKAEAAKMLALIESPEVAAKMLTLRKYGLSRTIARGWLERLPAHAVDGLAPLLVKPAKEATPAIDYLRELKRKGLGWLIEKRAEHMEPAVARAVKEKILDFDPTRLKKVTPADSGLAAILPPVKVRNDAGQLRRLTQPQMAKVIADLRTTPLGEPSPTLDILRANAERASVDTFVWGLFSDWLEGGAPSKDKWKFEALGHLGGDSVALKLTPLVRTWPGESQHARATAGLDILRAIGTDTALMQIHGISEKVSFKGIKDRAKECLNEIADARGFTPAELADRIIPDGGLDERGSRTFDFGPRQFTFVLSPDLKPMVRDDSGKRLPDLPKPNTRDDEAKSSESVASWKLLKKQVAEIARSQAVRLEQAMVVGRRWTPADFETLFVSHPVMAHLVRRLIWSGYDAAGRSLVSFRVGEDNSYSGETDESLELPAGVTSVGIVHPSHLSVESRSLWGEVLADYEIVPPFVQLGRPTYALTDDEKSGAVISRFADVGPIDPKVWVFGLENLGWERGPVLDGGSFQSHIRRFDSVGLVAEVAYDGVVGMGDPSYWEDITIGEIAFHAWDETRGKSPEPLPLATIDPVIASEVLHDISRLIVKGRRV